MEQENTPFGYKLVDVQEIQNFVSLRNPAFEKLKGKKEHSFNINYGYQLAQGLPESKIAFITLVTVSVEASDPEPFLTLEVAVVFEIEQMEKHIQDSKLIIPDTALTSIITTSIGVTRGILWGQVIPYPVQGTRILLPLIDIEPLLAQLK